MRLGITFAITMIITAIVAATLARDAEPKRAREAGKFPPVSDLVSKDATVRNQAMVEYLGARKELMRKLAAIIHPKTGHNLSRKQRGSACFVLGKLRTTDQTAITALIAVIDEHFITRIKRIPFGLMNPASALIAIGKPAVAPVLDELANTEDKQKTASLRRVLEAIEGIDCALIRVQAHVDKEANPKKNARLKMTLKYFEERKANMRKK